MKTKDLLLIKKINKLEYKYLTKKDTDINEQTKKLRSFYKKNIHLNLTELHKNFKLFINK